MNRTLVAAAMFTAGASFAACSSSSHGTGGGGQGGAATSHDGGTAQGGGTSVGGGSPGGAPPVDGALPSYDCQHPHPAWLLCDDFEAMADGYAAWRSSGRWTENIGADDPGRMTSSNEAHTGNWSLYMPAAASAGYQGADLMYRTCQGENEPGCALQGYDQLYFRAYVKLAPDHERAHHFLAIAGSQQYWDAYGNAGCRPNGSKATGTTVDFEADSHDSYFYTYFPEMSCDSEKACNSYNDAQAVCDGCAARGLPCMNGLECCWGNDFHPSAHVAFPKDEWFCLEMMMKVNTVGQKDGEMAYWVDGVLANEKKDMGFRTTPALQLNMVRLQHYNETWDVNDHANRVWFDDVVVSTERIGCM
ncbi:Hypothetical protein A7982_02201 [Minicystis rosea]|nr:Hypothetical protein A7982_02201 [Minicystis rosea]